MTPLLQPCAHCGLDTAQPPVCAACRALGRSAQPNYYTAENGASLAYRDAEGRIVGEPDQESDEDEPIAARRIS